MALRDEGVTVLAPNESWSRFIHGYSDQEVVTYSIVVFPGSGEGPEFGYGAKLTQGESFRHVDGTQAYKVYFENINGYNSCVIRLFAKIETT